MSERKVPVAYVTRGASEGRPIVVERNVGVTDDGYLMPSDTITYVHPGQWSEDRAEAETHWRQDAEAALREAEEKVLCLKAALAAGPWADSAKAES